MHTDSLETTVTVVFILASLVSFVIGLESCCVEVLRQVNLQRCLRPFLKKFSRLIECSVNRGFSAV